MNLLSKHLIPYSALLLTCMVSCTSNLPVKNEVVVYVPSDPEMLNPCNFMDEHSGYITSYMFQKLIDVNFKNPSEFIPVLAESRPNIEKTPDGKMLLTFKIRQEATWDNNSPITAKDVEFTLKVSKNPLVSNSHYKPYFEFINDFIFYPDDPKKFTIVSNKIYFLAEALFMDVAILPEYFYDPKGLMKNYSLKQIVEKSDSLKSDAGIKEFADDFNSENRMRNPDFIEGSGPYKFTEWKTNERVILTKKEQWWGIALKQENCFFEANPEKLIFQTIKDQTTAIVALKAGNLDLMTGIKSKDFAELPKSEKFTNNFNTYNPIKYAYMAIGINTKKPMLSDKITRHALAYIVNVDEMIQTVKYGKAERIIGPIHPSKKKAYNSSIQPYPFDLDRSKELLEKAGWKNTNGDETLDKIINGKRTEFVLNFIINAGNDERKAMALMFQEQAKKVGIMVNVTMLDWAVYIDKCKNHEFDLTFAAWTSGPTPDDLKQIYHSESAAIGGSNFFSFSNAEADSLIDAVNSEIDENKRNKMYLHFQEILNEELPMIYLYAPVTHLAVSKKFENAYPSVARPGYWLPGFQLKGAASE